MAQFEGMVEKIVYRNDESGWTVASVKMASEKSKEPTSIVGILPSLEAGGYVVFEGEWVNHDQYGRQIRVSSYKNSRPEGVDAIEKYLAAGFIRGVGEPMAKRIVAHFGNRTLEVLEQEPERLIEVKGIGKKNMTMIAESFAAQNEKHTTLMFLESIGFTPAICQRIEKAYGEMTEKVVRENPYRLVDEIEGVGFQTADKIALSLGFSMESAFRLRSGVKYVMNEAVNGMGHMYLPEDMLIQQSCEILNADVPLVETVIKQLLLEGTLIAEDFVSPRAVYLSRIYNAECEVARLLRNKIQSPIPEVASEARLNREIEDYESFSHVHLCEAQRKAVIAAAGNGVMVITGGPGTGKTTSINCLIHILQKAGIVELCAPTGRAAKRMSEATGRPAQTVHRLLEYSGESSGFLRNADNPLDADIVIVDEMSMVDIFLMRSLLKALRAGSRLILVGDADQLP